MNQAVKFVQQYKYVASVIDDKLTFELQRWCCAQQLISACMFMESLEVLMFIIPLWKSFIPVLTFCLLSGAGYSQEQEQIIGYH